MGAAVALGPLLGGFLTTNYSWRWAFVINVIIAPAAIVGALLFMREPPRSGRRERIDVPGALLISSGMLLLVFGISEGSTYGWWRPMSTVHARGRASCGRRAGRSRSCRSRSCSRPLLLTAFVRVELAKERAGRDPLFEFSNLRRLGFRYGLATLVVLAMGQTAFLLVISVLLQDGRHLERARHRTLARAVGRVHRDRRAGRRPPDPPHRHHRRGPGRPRARGARARRHRAW